MVVQKYQLKVFRGCNTPDTLWLLALSAVVQRCMRYQDKRMPNSLLSKHALTEGKQDS